METPGKEIPQRQDHRSHHRSGKRHQSRRTRTKKVMQRLAILFVFLLAMLAIFYVWVSCGSPEATGRLLQLPSTKDVADLI